MGQACEIPPTVATGGVVPGLAASPGIQFGRAGGPILAGTYLQVLATVPSNTAGVVVPFNGVLTGGMVTCEAVATFTIEIERRSGAVFTLFHTFTITAVRKQEFSGLTVAFNQGDEFVAKVGSVTSGPVRNCQIQIITEQS